jgi:cytochrome c oxidase subunit 2
MRRPTAKVPAPRGALLLWALLTAAGLWAAAALDYYPVAASAESGEIRSAVRLLTLYAVPVFTLVVTVLAYAVARFRVRGGGAAQGDGPPLKSHRAVTWGWLVVTTALAALLFVSPGLTGLAALRAGSPADLVVKVEAVQWHWSFAFQAQELQLENPEELVLPVGRRVRFEITSRDVVHSLWIPAFGMKQDANPGRVTAMEVTPTRLGTFTGDSNFRVQCAELCGIGHASMLTRVRVVEVGEFARWVERTKREMGGMTTTTMGGMGQGG